jgi:hypothetical protein
VSWGFFPNNQYFSGDDFTIQGSGPYVITKLRVWGTAGAPGDATFTLSDRYRDATLYLGIGTAGAMSPVKLGNLLPGTNDSDNLDITFAKDWYEGGADYQGSSTSFIQIWSATFDNIFFTVNAGDLVKFGAHVTTYDENRFWFNHSSNAAFSGNTQDGADDLFRYFDALDLVNGDGTFDSKPVSLGGNGGWDKSSDVNVLVWAIPLTDGMATGGGWYMAEPGDFVGTNPDGRASFGFVAKRSGSRNSGILQFQYQADGLNFHSDLYSSVYVSNTQAIFEGEGTLNGTPGLRFRVSAVDGDKVGGGQPDRFSIRIWTSDPDSPVHQSSGNLSGGQIVVHKR